MPRKEPEATLLLRNIILPVRHCSLLMEASSPAWLARWQQASGTAWLGLISLNRLSLKSSGLFTPQQSNWRRERRRERPFIITKCPFVHYPPRCISAWSRNIDLNFTIQLLTGEPARSCKHADRSSVPRVSGPYRRHDGIPRGGEDVGVVVALIMSLQLLGEVFSGQLKQSSTS